MTAIRRFFADLFGAYLDGIRVAAGLPLLFGAIIVWEFAQHIIEYRLGFYRDAATARAVSLDEGRMALGWVKMILVYVGGFFAIRYLVLGSASAALRPSGRTVLRYLPYVAYSLIVFATIFYAGSFVPTERVMTVRGIVGLTQVAVEPLLMLWIVSAATDGPIRNPLQSARVLGWRYVWALPLYFVGRIPISVAHQALGRPGSGHPDALLWPMLLLDLVAVGLLVVIIPALYVRVARYVGERTDAPLTPAAVRHPR